MRDLIEQRWQGLVGSAFLMYAFYETFGMATNGIMGFFTAAVFYVGLDLYVSQALKDREKK